MPLPAYIFDVDGTITDASHRQHFVRKKPKDWASFNALCGGDAPHTHICGLIQALDRAGEIIVFVSGRNEKMRDDTIKWIKEHIGIGTIVLYMRADQDYRDDSIVKVELLNQLKRDGYRPIMAFDDRDRVVKMWRDHGVPCAQVAEGNF